MSSPIFTMGLISSWCIVEIIPWTRSPKAYLLWGWVFFYWYSFAEIFSRELWVIKPQPLDVKANVCFFFSPGWVFTLFWKLMLKCTWNKRKLFIEMHYKNTADIFGGFLFLSHRLICGLHSTIYSTYICFITISLYATANCENYFCVLYKLSVAGLHEVNISHIWGTGDKCHHFGLF